MLETYVDTQVARNLPQADGSVCTDPRLLIIRSLCKVSQKFAVHHSIRELGHHCQNSSNCLLTDDGCYVCKASNLDQHQYPSAALYSFTRLTIWGKILSLTSFCGR